jgi:hypothetical protein
MTEFEWLQRHIENAASEIALWPEWKRNASTLTTAEACMQAMDDLTTPLPKPTVVNT